MADINNGDNRSILDLLKEQAEKTPLNEEIDPQTTETGAPSDDDIKDMLKKHFAAESNGSASVSEDYSYDTDDFVVTGEIQVVDEPISEDHSDIGLEDDLDESSVDEAAIIDEALNEDDVITESVEERDIQLGSFDQIEEVVQEILDEAEMITEETIEEIVEINEAEESLETAFESEESAEIQEIEEIEEIEEMEETFEATVHFTSIDEPLEINEATNIFEAVSNDRDLDESVDEMSSEPIFVHEIIEEQMAIEDQITINEVETDISKEDEVEEGPAPEESINYDEVLEGQQGTVFNSFVEDFTGDLDDVVFEAEITDSHAPAKQYTIFEDWEQLMKDKQYETAEEGIIPPTKEEIAYSAEIAARAARSKTDYFTSIAGENGIGEATNVIGEVGSLDPTDRFEKIREDVNASKDISINIDKNIYGFCGEEFTSILQTPKIKKKYKSDKSKLIFKTVATALLCFMLISYEMTAWMGMEMNGVLNISNRSNEFVFIGLLLLLIPFAISASKIKAFFTNMLGFSSISYVGAMLLFAVCVLYDILLLAIGTPAQATTIHSFAAILFLIALVYDLLDVYQQAGVFGIVSKSNKKLVLEPYGKLRVDDSESKEALDKDSYRISRASGVSGFFARMAKDTDRKMQTLVSLVASLVISLLVMIVLLIAGEGGAVAVFSFAITLSFAFVCASIFESEFAFFISYKILKKYKTGIIGKASVEEYGRSSVVYFDDFNVFNKKSVRTKGLKLYNNDEIYRILYHTQAVFSKIGGPLKGVFEFATTEMLHSKNVEIQHIGKDGICALVDNRTSVIIGSGSFMKSCGIHPSYTSADLLLEESGEESIVFIALNGTLGAKLYVTYQFSAEFERLAKKLTSCGIGIGIRSSDPSINDRWAKSYGSAKKCSIRVIRPTLKELKPQEKAIDGGLVSIKNVRAISEAVMMCTRLYSFESVISKIRIASMVIIGALILTLVMISGINMVSMLLLLLACALFTSIMILLSHFYIKR